MNVFTPNTSLSVADFFSDNASKNNLKSFQSSSCKFNLTPIVVVILSYLPSSILYFLCVL